MTTNINKDDLKLWSEVLELYLNPEENSMITKFQEVLIYLRKNKYAKVELEDNSIVLVKHYDSEDGLFLTEDNKYLHLDEIVKVL